MDGQDDLLDDMNGHLSPADWVRQHGHWPLWQIRIDALAERPIELQDPVCSVTRGLLGDRLRDLRCLTRAPGCQGCESTEACDYFRVFEVGKDTSSAAPPYWLQGLPARPFLEAGEHLRIRLVVLGAASDVLPYLEASLRDALLRLGRAAHTPGPYKPALLLRVHRAQPLTWPAVGQPSDVWSLTTRTPLVLMDSTTEDNLCPQAPVLARLVRAGARRLYRLARAQGGGTLPTMDLPDLSAVKVRFGRMVPWQGSRFSQRQRRRMPLEGVVGHLELQGEALRELSPLLALLPLLNVGKQTTMGFGHLDMRALTP